MKKHYLCIKFYSSKLYYHEKISSRQKNATLHNRQEYAPAKYPLEKI